MVTDQLRSYPAAKVEIPELADVKHVFVKAAARVNNRAENSHQPTRERERRMKGFRLADERKHSAVQLRTDPTAFRHQAPPTRRCAPYRNQLARRFAIWHPVTSVTKNPSTAV
ncbi:hypothetical protein [Candidatus Skiveiella danica]|uniref:hypothetical protein n=1 Tax=Candidatus Skiveiella danica TaxID=3386177 RepID=UPI001DC10BAE|nr:hypothetical protein [Betaproteobacteria bacterium]